METQLLYLHKYLYGGATTFTAHLMHILAKHRQNNIVLRVGKRTESKPRYFGYGWNYHNVSESVLPDIQKAIIVIFKEKFLNVLKSLNDVTMIIHDYRDISEEVVPHILTYKIVTIRKTVQKLLKEKYGLESTFKPHPFYPYPVALQTDRYGAVSISRISFEKNIDMIVTANQMLDSPVKIYGCPSRLYVYNLDPLFERYYFGLFEKSFGSLSHILSKARFVVDLSVLKHDGGGTQYTFLEAIHNKCAIILHRKWLELDPQYCDFKEGYNCFAVSSSKELAELLRSDPDTTEIVNNASKLMDRHVITSWSDLL